jgi:hypothetical protein
MESFFNFWDDPMSFPDSLKFGFEPVAEGRGRLLEIRMEIEGLRFKMVAIPVGEA